MSGATKWSPGMRDRAGWRMLAGSETRGEVWADPTGDVVEYEPGSTNPNSLDLDDPAAQGCLLAHIAESNARKSMHDALHDVAHAMGRGLSYPEALVFVLEGL